jgi:hypothetical protein
VKVDVGWENLDLVSSVRRKTFDLPEDRDRVAGSRHNRGLLHHLQVDQIEKIRLSGALNMLTCKTTEIHNV